MPRERDIDPPALGRAGLGADRLRARPAPRSRRLGGDSRAAVLEFIEAADDVVRVEQIAEAVGLHPNTVRGHLDALLASGRITRVPDQRSTRGRPHWLYSGTASASIRELARALDSELDRASAPDVARLAAATWAEAGPDVGPADTVEGGCRPGDPGAHATSASRRSATRSATRSPCGRVRTPSWCTSTRSSATSTPSCSGRSWPGPTQPVTLASLDVFPRPGPVRGAPAPSGRGPGVDRGAAGPRSQGEGLALQLGAGAHRRPARHRTTTTSTTQKAATPSPRKKK